MGSGNEPTYYMHVGLYQYMERDDLYRHAIVTSLDTTFIIYMYLDPLTVPRSGSTTQPLSPQCSGNLSFSQGAELAGWLPPQWMLPPQLAHLLLPLPWEMAPRSSEMAKTITTTNTLHDKSIQYVTHTHVCQNRFSACNKLKN